MLENEFKKNRLFKKLENEKILNENEKDLLLKENKKILNYLKKIKFINQYEKLLLNEFLFKLDKKENEKYKKLENEFYNYIYNYNMIEKHNKFNETLYILNYNKKNKNNYEFYIIENELRKFKKCIHNIIYELININECYIIY